MKYLVRKFTEGAWPNGVERQFVSKDFIDADCICTGLKTDHNKMSWWLIEDLNELEAAAISIASAYKSKGRIFVVAIPFQQVIENKIKTVNSIDDADTAITSFRERHYNLENLTYFQLGILAELVAISCQKNETRKTLSFGQIKNKIKELILNGNIETNELSSIYNVD